MKILRLLLKLFFMFMTTLKKTKKDPVILLSNKKYEKHDE